MATLIRHPKGIYFAQFYDRARRPQRKRLSLRTRNRRTAERLLARLDAGFLLGEYDPWAAPERAEQAPTSEATPRVPVQLGDAVAHWLAACAHLRPYTRKTYDEITRPFVAHLSATFPLADLRADHVVGWLDTTNAAPITKRKYAGHLGYLFRHLVRLGALDRDLSKEVKLERVPEQAPKALTPEMVTAFVEAARAWKGAGAGDGLQPCDYGWLGDVVEANVELGLRRGELLALRPAHVHLDRGVLVVANDGGFETKSGKERALPLSTTARAVLTRRLGVCREFVFEAGAERLTPDRLSRSFLRVRRRAGLPNWANLHSTRHTALTRLVERGVPVEVVRQFAGHSSVIVTERYCRMRPDVVSDHVRRAFG